MRKITRESKRSFLNPRWNTDERKRMFRCHKRDWNCNMKEIIHAAKNSYELMKEN